MTNPANKTVLITGAGGGFGRQLVLQFRAAGAKLLLTDVSDQALQGAVEDAGVDLAASVASDLAREEGCDAVIEMCRSLGGVPDILVNNAGLAMAGRLDHVPRDQWETLMQLNLMAPMRLTNSFLPGMVERDSGHIMNISSVAGWMGAKGMSSYCASKFGLRGFGETLAADLRDTGVHVTNVYPSFSRTPILDSPQHGYEERRVVPEYLLSEPADVVARALQGMRRRRLHVFPDRYARVIHYLTRFAPWLLLRMERRLQAKAIEAGRMAD
ncbi:MAG: SDR family NAD(P)-dependent oxidoreductase [Gammaproteobacteria bacterium]|nr:SDR family NAD(P)-dependent oxidoreductase [Gammaproteobacteria bacterium]